MGFYKGKTLKAKNGENVTIRSASKDDAKHLIDLGKAIAAEKIYTMTDVDEIPSDLSEEIKWIEKYSSNTNNLLLVAETDNKLVGVCDFEAGSRRRISHTGRLGLGVAKEFRGLGIGEFLLTTVIEWATDHNTIEKLCLTVHHDNDRAKVLYEKLGFVEEGIIKRDIKYSEKKYVDSILMALFVKK
ncbi:MAG: GNAT family N-acetyltransferase [Deltaproteobacteria bacterium]|nr:GNAT family N-acetyltransferase [Deltaproteobacteria bacterium]